MISKKRMTGSAIFNLYEKFLNMNQIKNIGEIESYEIHMVDSKRHICSAVIPKDEVYKLNDPQFVNHLKRELVFRLYDQVDINSGCYFEFEIEDDTNIEGQKQIFLKAIISKKENK